MISIPSISQKSNISNTEISPQDALKMIFENIGESEIKGGHQSGSLNGWSYFKFSHFIHPIIDVNSVLMRLGQPNLETIERGRLTNIHFETKTTADFNTKVIVGDWGTSANSKYAKFKLYLTNDYYKNEVYVVIKGSTNWSHWARIELKLPDFQKIINILSFSKKSLNISLMRAKEDSLAKQITSHTKKIGKLIVSKFDFPEKLTRIEAEKIIRKLSGEWRLPSIDELQVLYKEKFSIGEFKNDIYCSDTYNSYTRKDYILNFNNGTVLQENLPGFIRVVKNFDLEKDVLKDTILIKKIKGNLIDLGDFFVSQYDYFDTVSWDDANKISKSFGIGWRLPSKDELDLIYNLKDQIGGFNPGIYWSGSITSNNSSIAQRFDNGKQGAVYNDSKFYIRPIFEIPANLKMTEENIGKNNNESHKILINEIKAKKRELEAKIQDSLKKRNSIISDSIYNSRMINFFESLTQAPIPHSKKLFVSKENWVVKAKIVLPSIEKYLNKEWRLPLVKEMKNLIDPSLLYEYNQHIEFFNNWGPQIQNFLCVDESNNLVILNIKRSGGSALAASYKFSVQQFNMDEIVIVRFVMEK